MSTQEGKTRVALVVGAEGFIGSHLIEALLNNNWSVRGIDIPNAQGKSPVLPSLLDLDLRCKYKDILDLHPEDEIFQDVDHLFYAVMSGNHIESIRRPETIFASNLLPLIHTLEIIRGRADICLHYLSSAAVYGAAKGHIDESTNKAPVTPYGLNKVYEELAVEFWKEHYKIQAKIYRIFACYGPWQSSGGVFGKFTKAKFSGDVVTLDHQGAPRRDFTYVKDIVEGVILGASIKSRSNLFNLGRGIPCSIRSLADSMEISYQLSGEAIIEDIMANNSRAQSELGWTPRFSLDQGVNEALTRMRLKK